MKILKKNLFKNILLLFSSTILVLLLFELYLRLFNPQIFDIHPKGIYINDEDVGYVLTPGFNGYIKREEFINKIYINNIGCRGNDFNLREEGGYRTLVLGDSFAFGFGVEEEETFSVHLERLLNRYSESYKVLNAGVPGYGTIDQLNFLKSRGEEIKPDLIIVQILSDNDFEENRFSAKQWAIVEDGWLKAKESNNNQNSFFVWKDAEYWLKKNLHSAKFLSGRLGYLLFKYDLLGIEFKKYFWNENISQDDVKLFKQTLVEFLDITKKLDAKLIFLFTTGQIPVLAKKNRSLDSEKMISEVLEDSNIEWINIYRLMKENEMKDSFYYPIDGHWTPSGHLFVAEILYDKIIRSIY